MIEGLPGDLAGQVIWLIQRVKALERRADNQSRTGTIAEVDEEKGLARVKISSGTDKDYLSPWIPWKEISSGKIKTSFNPSVGEQVGVVSESGDITDAVIEMSSPSSANERPHKGVEAVIQCEGGRVEIGETIKMTAPTAVNIEAPEIVLSGFVKTIGKITNNGVNIGSDHKHTGVIVGGAKTGNPS